MTALTLRAAGLPLLDAVALAVRASGDSIRRDAAGVPTGLRLLKAGLVSATVTGREVRGHVTREEIAKIEAEMTTLANDADERERKQISDIARALLAANA
jgi:hypothetical protein